MALSVIKQIAHLGDNVKMSMSKEDAMVKEVLATHSRDGRDIDVKHLLPIVDNILSRSATFQVDTHEAGGSQLQLDLKMDAASFTSIGKLSCEMACNCKALEGADNGHASTVSLFKMLSDYPWDAKLVLTLAAFSLNYGEFWLLAQVYTSNQLAKSMAILKQYPSIMERTGPMKPPFDAVNDLSKTIMDVTRCVIEFKELQSFFVSQDRPAAFSTAKSYRPKAVYWAVRSTLACAIQITILTSMGTHETTATTELSFLAHKLKNIYDDFKKQMAICYQVIEERKTDESYQKLVNLFKTVHNDNLEILKTLIYAKDDLQPLVVGSTKKKGNMDVLKRKNVLLLISGLDISGGELWLLDQIYKESSNRANGVQYQYEIVWIPIVEQWDDAMQKKFESLQSSMPWYTVHHPTLIEKAVIRFIKEDWHFKNKSIVVVLDPQGNVVCPNAIHMMWIWGSKVFPFTKSTQEALWKKETWSLELLLDGIDQTILTWIKEGKYIFLYGGDDIKWVREVAKEAKTVANAAGISFETVYVGKNSEREKVLRVMETIKKEKLGYCLQDLTTVWRFWTRIESMFFSKIELGRADDHNDSITQEIKKLMSYEKDGSWGVLSKGSQVVVNGHGTTVLSALSDFKSWKESVSVKGFDLSFKEHHEKLRGVAHLCSRFEFSTNAGKIPDSTKCPECHRNMEKFIAFRCCHGDHVPGSLY